ncbi:ociB domain protein [Burkholderia pseudomallei MSHR4000]|nr:ociB domain protein [Burkholderia pseudomallei MSHR4000]
MFRRAIVHRRCRIARKHDHLAHSRHLRQLRLDLPQLDPESAYLHLEVVSTQILQAPVRTPTRQIPRLIQPPARHERIVDEPLPRQLRPVQIPPRHLHATDIQLPRHTDRRRTQPRIQHINPRIRNWTPNDIRIVVSPPNLVHRHADRGFRRPVRVEKARPTAFLGKPCIERRRTDRFAADHHAAYAGRDRPTPTQGELAKKLRGQIDDTDPLRPAQRPERLGIRQPPIGPQHERRAATQRREDLLDRSIESDVGKLQHTIGCIEFEILGQRTDLIDHARVLDHHALRCPRRSRRVDHVRKAPRTDVWLVRSA